MTNHGYAQLVHTPTTDRATLIDHIYYIVEIVKTQLLKLETLTIVTMILFIVPLNISTYE